MARKRVRNHLGRLKRKDENFFELPEASTLPRRPKKLAVKARGCKPNTRYKVLLDNFPGRDFEDIQHTVKPFGESVKVNPRDFGNRNYQYLVSDEQGKIDFTCMPYGSDAFELPVDVTSRPQTSRCWSQFKTRTRNIDRGRDRVCLIEAGQINNPFNTDRIKQVKFEYNAEDKQDEGSNPGTTALPPGTLVPCFLPPIKKKKKHSPVDVRGSFYQTFYVNSRSVGGAKTVDLVDIELYLRRKPGKRSNKNGTELPGITVTLLDCNADGSPRLNSAYQDSVSTAEWTDIQASPLATSGTRFEFQSPITVETNKSYAICVNPESEEYVFWFSQKGDLLLVNGDKTEKRSGGSSKAHQGEYYPARTSTTRGSGVTRREKRWQPDQTLDLKFDVNIAEYTVGDTEFSFTHGDYEFIQLKSTADVSWEPGETVYKENTPVTGTCTGVVGKKFLKNGGTGDYSGFVGGDVLVLVDSNDDTQVQVFTVDGSRTPTTNRVFVNEYVETGMEGTLYDTVVGDIDVFDVDFKFMRLEASSVEIAQYNNNNDKAFKKNDTIRGVDSRASGDIEYMDTLQVETFRSSFTGDIPDGFKISTSHQFSEKSSGDVTQGTSLYALDANTPNMYLNAPNRVKYEAEILSKSLEVAQAVNMHNPSSEAKSSVFKMNFEYTGANTKVYSAPSFDLGTMKLVAHRFAINNDSENEHTNNGNASTKHVSKKLSFSGKQAEDIKVFVNAFRPRQTDVEVYAKIINSDDSSEFNDKYWTKLVRIAGNDSYSSPESVNDFREYEYTFPAAPESNTVADGDFTSTSSSATITGSSDSNVAVFSAGQVIKFYSPLFPENYSVFSIQSVDTGTDTIVVNEPITNTSIIGSGFKIDTLRTERTAFRNPQNDEIVRYFGTSGESYDNYDQVAIKIVLLAESRKLTPRVDDYRVVGVSV